jgi:hypothetical protein
MQNSPVVCCLAVAVVYVTPTTLRAEIDQYAAARAEVRLELELAKRESRYYWQIEYPRERRLLNAAIELTEAEIRRHRALWREYRSFNRYSVGNPLSLSVADLEICLLDAELRLDELRHERNNLVRFHSDEARLRDLRVVDARRRLIELEGGELIEIGTPQ